MNADAQFESQKIIINDFCRRQTVESQFSHFGGSDLQLIGLIADLLPDTKGDDGVFLVEVPEDYLSGEGNPKFFSGVVELGRDSIISAAFQARRDGEKPFVQLTANGEKLPAKAVTLVVYANEKLGDDATESDSDFELVSINARATEGPEPQHPVSMARNFLGLEGGTKRAYSAEEFAEAITYWSARAMRTPTG